MNLIKKILIGLVLICVWSILTGFSFYRFAILDGGIVYRVVFIVCIIISVVMPVFMSLYALKGIRNKTFKKVIMPVLENYVVAILISAVAIISSGVVANGIYCADNYCGKNSEFGPIPIMMALMFIPVMAGVSAIIITIRLLGVFCDQKNKTNNIRL